MSAIRILSGKQWRDLAESTADELQKAIEEIKKLRSQLRAKDEIIRRYQRKMR